MTCAACAGEVTPNNLSLLLEDAASWQTKATKFNACRLNKSGYKGFCLLEQTGRRGGHGTSLGSAPATDKLDELAHSKGVTLDI